VLTVIEPFTHPVSYAFMEATEENLAAAIEDGFVAISKHKRDIADLHARMEPLRERLAVLRGPAVLPRPSRRTDRQQLVAACPRCGGKLEGATA
jgi:hypothetical protein